MYHSGIPCLYYKIQKIIIIGNSVPYTGAAIVCLKPITPFSYFTIGPGRMKGEVDLGGI